MTAHDVTLLEAMEKLGYTDYSSPEQQEMVEAVLDGKDVLAIMRTGEGKTAGATLPAIMNGWLVLIVSPLKALMQDQCAGLREKGLPAYVVNGDTDETEFRDIFHILRQPNDGPVFVFTTPEMALTTKFSTAARQVQFDLLMVDEVHCVSLWGSGFREKYQRIKSIWHSLGKPQILAVSATADTKIINDVKSRVPFRKKEYVEIIGDPMRSNLHIQVCRAPAELRTQASVKQHMLQQIKDYLVDTRIPTHGPTIIYCTRIREAELLFRSLADLADANGYQIGLYHGQLEPEHRAESLRTFRNAQKPLIVATSAFGMGIDRNDVRNIFHFGPPSDLIEYAQQIGRAGRDGGMSYCWTLHMPWMIDRKTRASMKCVPTLEDVEKTYISLRRAWDRVQEQNKTRMHLGKFHYVHDEWLKKQDDIPHPEKHMAMRRAGIKMLADLGYVSLIEDYVTGVSSMKFATSTHNALIEMTEMKARQASRDAARLRKFFEAETPDQSLLFGLIAESD